MDLGMLRLRLRFTLKHSLQPWSHQLLWWGDWMQHCTRLCNFDLIAV